MNELVIGAGKLGGKGIYANRDFDEGELVMSYQLRELTPAEFKNLPKEERMFTHSFWGKIFLYPEPARYVNHSARPNTRQDLESMCDYAIRRIRKGEMITTNATAEIKNELRTYIENLEGQVEIIDWQKLGYRNARVLYSVRGIKKVLTIKRIDGNWHTLETKPPGKTSGLA